VNQVHAHALNTWLFEDDEGKYEHYIKELQLVIASQLVRVDSAEWV